MTADPKPQAVASGSPDARPRRRPKVERTNPEMVAMVRRMIRALRDRAVTAGDLDLLADVHCLHDDLDRVESDIVTALRGYPYACSWRDIGNALGIGRSAAQERFRKAGGIRRPGGQEAKYR